MVADSSHRRDRAHLLSLQLLGGLPDVAAAGEECLVDHGPLQSVSERRHPLHHKLDLPSEATEAWNEP